MKRPFKGKKSSSKGRDGSQRKSGRPSSGKYDRSEKSSSDRDEKKPYGDRKKTYGDHDEKKPYGDRKKTYGDRDEKKPYGDRKKTYGDRDEKKPYGDRKKTYGDRDEKKPYGDRKKTYGDRDEKKPYGDRKKTYGDRKSNPRIHSGENEDRKKPYSDRDDKKPYGDRKKTYGDRKSNPRIHSGENEDRKKTYGDRDDKKPYGDRKKSFGNRKPNPRIHSGENEPRTPIRGNVSSTEYGKNYKKKAARSSAEYDDLVNKSKSKTREPKNDDGKIRLNKYIANTGLCSRREADEMIQTGVIKVNGKVVTELGTRIDPTDKVMYGDQTLMTEKLVYLLLNKPKDYITTVDDPDKRKTVMELVDRATKERIYPVGRLDRSTTGVLLFTNDGEMTKKLTHPKYNVKKVYHVMTDQNVKFEDLQKLKDGFELEDGFIKADDAQFVGDASNKRDIGIEVHSGRNRIVRRMFEHLGYKVVKLDRVMFAGLTKKDLPRGKWRFLNAKEISFLKMNG